MKRTIYRVAVTLICAGVLLGVPLPARAQVTATLALIPDTTLPGIPVDVRVTLASASPEPVTVQRGVTLEVSTQSGETFYAVGPAGATPAVMALEAFGEHSMTAIALPPGATRDYYSTVGCELSAELFVDPRLSKPGRYSLRVSVTPAGAAPDASPIWSNAVTLTVQQPQGDDSAVWSMLLSRAAAVHRDGFGSMEWLTLDQGAIAEEIYAKYPRSSYVPYVACFKAGATPEDDFRNLQQAIALNPKGPIADRLKLMLSAVHEQVAQQARLVLDLDTALAEHAVARQLAQEVEAQSIYPFVRDQAHDAAFRIPNEDWTRKDVAASIEDRRSSPYKQVIPFVECVSIQHDGGLTARFGYRNLKDQTETIEAGSTNLIMPADAAKKLPTTFRAGVHKNAFHATSSGGPITWRLLTFAATANKDSPQCGGNH